MKRTLKLMLCLILALSLCGCTGTGSPTVTEQPTLTLPPSDVAYVAPIGDAALEYTATATLYLPRHDGTRLGARNVDIAFSYARPDAESVVRALLLEHSDGVLSAVGGDVILSLYGVTPVEVSRDVATVNLSATALQLDRQRLYVAAQAITRTLCELPGINHVNLLVMDKPVGLDIANTLPLGTLGRSDGLDIAADYERIVASRQQSLSANATLYFPVLNCDGFMSEARACSFASREFADMALTLMRELAEGSMQGISTPTLPLLGDILLAPPALVQSPDTGGSIIELSFDYNLDDMLEANGLTRAQELASVCYTLLSFFPGVSGVRFSVGEKPVETLMLTDSFESSVTFENGIARRSDFSSLLYDECALYQSNGQKLQITYRPVRYYGAQSPRALILELANGVKPSDSIQGLQATMPSGAITDADILGLAAADGTLIVNLAQSFEAVCEGLSAHEERRLAYSIVNTLCRRERIKSVCFFISGVQRESLSGEIYWKGLFYPIQ